LLPSWNIRVELSRPVYKTLHQIDTLKVLHLRLQAGPSLYEEPPPLPFSGPSSAASSVLHLPDPLPPPPPPPVFPTSFNIPVGAQVFYVAPTGAPPPLPAPTKPVARTRPLRKTSFCKGPPTLSGFKNLKSLSILDIDSLDIITELKSCVRNSASTLTKLQLSFSHYLGSQARKPPPDVDPDESDPDDEFQVVPNPPVSGLHDDASGPARVFRAQEELKSQEAVLGRIFDVEPYLVKRPAQKTSAEKENGAKDDPASSLGERFVKSFKDLTRDFMEGTDRSPAARQDLLSLIEEAARKYVNSDDGEESRQHAKTAGEGSSTSNTNPKPENEGGEAGDQASGTSLFDAAAPKPIDSSKDASPDDINIEEPLEQLTLDFPEPARSPTPPFEVVTPNKATSTNSASLPNASPRNRTSGSPGVEKAVNNLEAQKTNFKTLAEKLESFENQAKKLNKEIQGLRERDGPTVFDRLAEAEKQMQSFSRNIHDIHEEMRVVEAEIDDAEKQMAASHNPQSAEAVQQQRMADYLRSTRGLALQTLDIYLVPVKASVLHKAIDIRALRRITLLNVGPQGAIWTLFHKENKESPLALRKIFTDNVSTAFLNFVASLEEVHDLFMLERDSKYKPESLAPRTKATITHIRRLVLKKHMGHLRRLMVKNQLDQSWDFDEKTFSLVCSRGEQLQELACSTTIKAMVRCSGLILSIPSWYRSPLTLSQHIFMRKMANLVSLRALHIVSLRNDDTCVWVMRETKEFLLDNLSHHPEMKLEWVSIDEDDRVDRILMPSELLADAKHRKKAKKDKGKQQATSFPVVGGSSSFPVFPPLDTWDAGSDSDEDGEEEAIRTVERVSGVRFYDVWDVTIFKKEVVYGRL